MRFLAHVFEPMPNGGLLSPFWDSPTLCMPLTQASHHSHREAGQWTSLVACGVALRLFLGSLARDRGQIRGAGVIRIPFGKTTPSRSNISILKPGILSTEPPETRKRTPGFRTEWEISLWNISGVCLPLGFPSFPS